MTEPYLRDTIVDWLRTLPADTELVWGDNHETTDGCHTGWVDVAIQGADLNLSWIWTIDDGSDPDMIATDGTSIIAATDRTLWTVYDTDIHWYLEPAYVTTADGILAADKLAELEALIDEAPMRRSLALRAAWSVETLNASLTNWVVEHAGRTDITFRYNPDYIPGEELIDQAAATAEAVAAGEAATYEFAPGVFVTDQVFDHLLTLDADQLTQVSARIAQLGDIDR
jgi:hypothetical protein